MTRQYFHKQKIKSIFKILLNYLSKILLIYLFSNKRKYSELRIWKTTIKFGFINTSDKEVILK